MSNYDTPEKRLSIIDKWLNGIDFMVGEEESPRYLPAIIYPNLLPVFEPKPRSVIKFKEIIKLMLELNIAVRDTLCFKSACLFFFILSEGNLDIDFLYRHSKYKKGDIKTIMQNWLKNKIFVDGKFFGTILDFEPGDIHWITEFTLISCCGSGELVRYIPETI